MSKGAGLVFTIYARIPLNRSMPKKSISLSFALMIGRCCSGIPAGGWYTAKFIISTREGSRYWLIFSQGSGGRQILKDSGVAYLKRIRLFLTVILIGNLKKGDG